MSVAEPRAIHELVAMYQLEPGLCDVYVEGSTDRALVEWFLLKSAVSNLAVKEIDTIDVPVDLIHAGGYENNNRGRVIALAHELRNHLGDGTTVVTCIADKEFDGVLGRAYGCSLLLLTDYHSIEIYFFGPTSLDKLLKLVVRSFPRRGSDVIVVLVGPLTELFAVRLANHMLGWGMRMVSFQDCCSLVNGAVVFDSGEYINRCLNANNRYTDKARFVEVLREAQTRLGTTGRHSVHGHDFVDMLYWYIRQHKGFKAIGKDTIERAIFGCVEYSDLTGEAMWRQLLERVRAQTGSG